MATLYDYLARLVVGNQQLIWSFKPLNKSEIDAAAGRPYVRVTELSERPTLAMYGNQDVVEATVDLQIFQAPDSDGRTPSREQAMEVYYDLYDAPSYVDEWIYGQTLIAIHRDLAFPPNYDEDSGGLAGMIRYRLLFPRG